ncbi:parallel beta-helix repeat protein [Sphingobacterium alimentarium]|uniref:Parallel beta-helix repeat protein n=1 Tax=Sphingobacterium alimentarium TaxID=797292 RepID=A0A4R3VY64_9SPHI|nr:glycosyl hydrolase family 28-related protein [Sphingobacterium alimentarium]TCV10500.1 parallel beta-helix repeat protein [Sphingobacterium alimentarium]
MKRTFYFLFIICCIFPVFGSTKIDFKLNQIGKEIDSNVSIINVKNYGAKGDGIHDDGPAFQNIINSLRENQTLYIPKGKYLIRQTLQFNKSNVTVRGDGEDSKLIYKWGKFSRTKKLLYGFHINSAKNVLFSDFSINGGSSNFNEIIIDDWKDETWDVDGAYNLFLIQPKKTNSVNGLTFKNLVLSNSFFDGIHSYARPADPLPKNTSYNIKIINCSFFDIGSNAVGLGLVNGLLVEESKFHNIGLMRMTIQKNGGGMAVDASGGAENVIIRYNYVDKAAAGFKCETHENNSGRYLPSKNVTISNNIIKNLFQGEKYEIFYGIKANGVNVIVENNTIESFYHGILVGINAKNVFINNNSISTTGKGAAGIRLDMNQGGHIVSNNKILFSDGQGILVSDASDITLSNNIILNSMKENIRMAGGKNVKIYNNICANAGTSNISITPVEGLSIENVDLKNNYCYDFNGAIKPLDKRILIDNSKKVISNGNKFQKQELDNNLHERATSENNSNLYFSLTKPSKGNFQKGQVLLKRRLKSSLNTDKIIGWECIESGNPGVWKEISVN